MKPLSWQLERIIVAICCVALATGSLVHICTGADIETLQKGTLEWVRLRTETVKLESDWKAQHSLLESSIKALNERQSLLQEKLSSLEAKTSTQRTETEDLAAKNKSAIQIVSALDQRLVALGRQILATRPLLPPRLSEAIELPCRSLATEGLSPAERMQHLMTVLSRCEQFNRSISCSDEVVRTGQQAALMEVAYWGLSQGYALDRTKKQCYLGRPTEKEWTWEPVDGSFAEVDKLIAICRDKADPDFVLVPSVFGQSKLAP